MMFLIIGLSLSFHTFQNFMRNWLSDYAKTSDIVYQFQHEFLPGHSTYMALIDMQDRITKATDNNEYSVGVFLI